MPEPFSFWKWVGGFFPTSGEKAGKLLFYAILIAVGIGVYHKIFVAKTQMQHNTTTVTAQPGSNITIEAPKQELKTPDKRWSTGPFVGIVGEKDNPGVFVGWVLLYNF